ncbi:MAG: glycoside hydrolase family 78 protein [Tannerella sp.]|jgi:hypothetical protein|nr:glycoside hydrolase family 78 protein [Tannerella sp.]
MKKTVFALIILLYSAVYAIAAPFSLYDLTCEHETAPLAVETLAPRFSWKIHATERGFAQSAYQIIVASTLENLAADKGDVWDSGKTASSQSILVQGLQLNAPKDGQLFYWKVRVWDAKNTASEWSEQQLFTTGLISGNAWGNARWLALEKDVKDEYIPMGIENIKDGLNKRNAPDYRMPQFSKKITVKKPVKRAVAYIAGVGHFDFFLNGEKVGNHFLDAGWTKYDKQALYVPFDITARISQGDNSLFVMLGNGFYNMTKERYLKLVNSFGAPKMKAIVKIEYADGTSEDIVSDASWQACESPITFSSIYGGEDYDARKTAKWQNALEVLYNVQLTAIQATPLTVRSEIPPVRVYKNGKGYYLYDLGQNFSGIIRVKVRAADSKSIIFRPAELLNPDSTVNQSATGQPFFFSYTTSGKGGTEQWQPQFTYYGFRYVQVEGAVPAGSDNPDRLPEIEALTGLHTCNSAPEAGSFVCSKPLFNQIHSLIDWALRSNMASVLTDCPHREKLGWLEQAHLMQYSLQYRYNLVRLYGKIMNDMQLSQWDNGCIPTIAPEYVRFRGGFEDTPEWGSSFILCPWYIYLWYGDQSLLQTCYPAMKRYIDYLSSRANNNIIAYGLGDWFDIGPNSPGRAQLTSNSVTATAIYYYCTTIMQQTATLLDKTGEAQEFQSLAEKIKTSFNKEFYDASTGKIERNSQTANAMALYVGLVDEKDRDKILQNLVDDIQGRGNALTAGDIGYRYVLRALEENGRSDVIYDMNTRYDVPGYGWMLAHDATALTESWQAYGFVSNNHFMLGHLMEWLYSGLGGIRQKAGSTAFSEIIIDPQAVGDVTSARTAYETPYGTVSCEWQKTDSEYRLKVSIPANTSAEIALPTTDTAAVTDYGTPITSVSGISPLRKENGKLWLRVGSGEYYFKASIGK